MIHWNVSRRKTMLMLLLGTAFLMLTACGGDLDNPFEITRNYYGAIATSLDGCQAYTGIASNLTSESAAHSAALNQCRNRGGTRCSFHAEFGSAYRGSSDCGAAAYGRRSGSCRMTARSGGTESAAQSAALAACRPGGYTCQVTLSACTD